MLTVCLAWGCSLVSKGFVPAETLEIPSFLAPSPSVTSDSVQPGSSSSPFPQECLEESPFAS